MRGMIASTGPLNKAMAHQLLPQDEKVNMHHHHHHNHNHQHIKNEPPPSARRSTRHGQQRDALKQSITRVSPSRERENKDPNRRRSRLACARCRQRKIKCSGENEDGQACTNCRNAGEETRCHFLRVKAMHCPAVGGATNLSPPNVNMYAQMHQKPAAVSSVRYLPYSRSPNYYMGPADTHPAFPRQSYGVEHGVNYEDPSAAVYNGQPAMHVLHSTPQGAWNDYYGLTWNPKGWNENEATFPDQGTENPLVQSAYSYMLAGQGTHRNVSNSTSQPQLMTPSPEVTSGLPYSPASGSPWEQKCADATTHRGSVQSITNEPFPTGPENHIKPDPGTQDMVLGYVPTIPSQNTPTIPNGTYPALDTVDPAAAGDFQTPPDTQFMRTYSRDSNDRLLSISTSSDYSPSDSYHYSSNSSNSGSEGGRTHSEASDSSATALVNGLPYSPVKQIDCHAHAQHGLQFNFMASDAMTDYHPEMQRALQGY